MADDKQRRSAAAAQLVEHVDAEGNVLAIVTRAEMRARSLRHRSVYIAVLDQYDRLLVHKRAPWKDVFPGAWDLAFGGVCDVGESWADSAVRELREEAGVSGDLTDHGPVQFEAPGVALVGHLYTCRHEGPFSFDDGEVTDVRWVPLAELASFVAANVVPPDSAKIVTVPAIAGTASAIATDSTPEPLDSPGDNAGIEVESRDGRQPPEERQVTTDLSAASVRPSGREGMAARTAAGFVALGSPDAAPLFTWIDEHQHSGDLIEGLAGQITDIEPAAFAMLFTASGQPWLVAWGAAATLIDGPTARFMISPTDGKLLVHELGLGDSDARIVMSNGPIADDLPSSPIELSEGSMPADLVSITLVDEPHDGSLIVPLVAPKAAEPDALAAEIDDGAGLEAQSEFGAGLDDESEPSAVTPAIEATEPGTLTAPPDDPVTDLPTGATEAVDAAATLGDAEPEPQIIIGDVDAKNPEDPIDIPVAAAVLDTPIPAPSAPPIRVAPPSIPPGYAPPAQASPFSSHLPADSEVPPEPDGPAQPPALGLLPAPAGPVMVLGVACPQGHHNHPDAVYCSQCGTKMGVHQTTVLVNGIRPPLGVLVVDDGTTFSIDQDLIVGRDAPSHADVRAGTASPMMLSDDSLALSRHHARIRLDDWSVFVTDLNSSNGTWFSRGSTGSWNRVSPDQSVALEAGDRIRVGGRVIQVELHHVRG